MSDIDLEKITNKNILVQIHLQRYLGLRREEAIKFKPYIADKGDHIELQPSWCKGGRGRIVPILSKEARHWIDVAKKLVVKRNQSLITAGKNYIQHRNMYDKQIRAAGIKHAPANAYAEGVAAVRVLLELI